MALLHSVATVGSYTAISRVFGFIRDVLTAAILGAGPVADAFFVAQRLPNLFRSLFAEGVVILAFEDLLTPQRRIVMTNRAVNLAQATINIGEITK